MKRFVCLALLLPLLGAAQTKKKPVAKTGGVQKNAQASIGRGEAVYKTYCLACHQADGSGVPNMNPPLIQNEWVLGPKSRLIEQVLKGSNGTVEIDGETFHNTMPPMGHLTDQQIADVITYVRKSFGNNASAATPAEVKVQRAKKK